MHIAVFKVYYGSEIRLVTGTGFKPDEGRFMAVSGGFNPHTLPPKYEDNNSPGHFRLGDFDLFREYELVAAFIAFFNFDIPALICGET